MQKRLLIFDLDGTLIDSAEDIVQTMNQVCEHMGESPISGDLVRSRIGEGLLKLMQDLFPHRTDWDDLVQKFRQIYMSLGHKHTIIYPGAIEFLQSWQGELAIVTNKSQAPTHHVLKSLGLDEFPWKSIIGGDTLSERKPHPLPLLTTLERLGRTPHEALMIGDAYPDMLAAEGACIESIAVTFGYSKIEELRRYKPVAFLHSYKDLPEIIAYLNGRPKAVIDET